MRSAFLGLLLGGTLWSQGSMLLVLQKGSSSLGFCSADSKLMSAVPVGRHPHEMVLSPDGRYAFTTDNGTMRIEEAGTGGNTVSIVDLVERKKAGEISLGNFRRPHGIDLEPNLGLLAVTTELPDRLHVIDVKTRAVLKSYPTNGKTSHMVTWGPGARWAYVSNSSSGSVAAIERATGKVIIIPTGERPEGSVLSADGKRLFVTNREARSITAIDTATRQIVGRIATGNGPVRIARTPDGKLLVYAVMHENKVEFADPVALRVVADVALPAGPVVSLHLSPDGRQAYASAEERDTVFVISVPERKLLRQFKTAGGAAPDPVIEIDQR